MGQQGGVNLGDTPTAGIGNWLVPDWVARYVVSTFTNLLQFNLI
jgi:hypothetical protein